MEPQPEPEPEPEPQPQPQLEPKSEPNAEQPVESDAPERAAVLEQKVAQLSLQLKAQTREVELWRKVDEAKQEEARILEELRAEDAEHDRLVAQLCSSEAADPRIAMPETLAIRSFQCTRVAFSDLNYPPGGWVCDICRTSMGVTRTTLYHSGPIGTANDNGFDCCLPCAAEAC